MREWQCPLSKKSVESYFSEESTALSYQEPKIPGPKPTEKAVSREKEPTKPEKESKEEKAETKPTSTSSSSKTTLSALAAYVDSDADSSGSESESPVAEKKRKKKKESDEDLDLDDIDKALESALEKKKVLKWIKYCINVHFVLIILIFTSNK